MHRLGFKLGPAGHKGGKAMTNPLSFGGPVAKIVGFMKWKMDF